MGIYLNPGNKAFEEAVNSEIFVDKTEMISCLNRMVRTEQKYVCVSRPRRFGKSMAVKILCAYYDREAESRSIFDKCKISKIKCGQDALNWDEYLGSFHVIRLVMTDLYSPFSVVCAMLSKQFANYWNQTETNEALKQYIEWNFDGLKEDVIVLMNGNRVPIDITGYQNDMMTFHSKDDILTMLIHLGYLGYDMEAKEVFIPNQEVLQVFKASTKERDWTVTFRALQNSRKLLEATWACEQDTVS